MLKYLFEVHLNDGTLIRQDQSDQSATTEGKNAFYDVLQHINDVVAFGFFSDETIDTVAVNLIDGSFNVNGTRFLACSGDALNLPNDAKFRLVYFKKVTQQVVNGSHTGTSTEFHCGWQTTVDGKNYQQTVSVS